MRNHVFSHRPIGPMLSTEYGGPAVLDRPENAAAIDEVLAKAPAEYEGDAAELAGQQAVEMPQPEVERASTESPDAGEAGVTFADLGLSPALLESILSVGYDVPTPIQERTIPVLLQGSDVIAQAMTGSGK